jgi:hypothetical protein
MNFTQIIATANAVASLLPVVATLVQGVENAMPAGTPGAMKLEAVKSGLASIYAAEQNLSVHFDAIWVPLQGMITTLVNAFNAAGLFVRKAQATTPAA